MVFFCVCVIPKLSLALEFQSGVGGGVQYTSNAKLASTDAVQDTIVTTYIGLGLVEEEGPLVYGLDATWRRENYLNNTFADRSYLNLGLDSRWEMIRDRFNWFLSDRFGQRPVVSTDAQTPDNTQDSNFFSFGANAVLLATGRHVINITPEFRQYNYEDSPTENRQYVLSGNWSYQVYRLLSTGLNGSVRKIDYSDEAFINTTFSNISFFVAGQPVRANYTINLGATTVSRDNGQSDTGFAGSINLLKELSSRSTIAALASTSLTDTSSAAAFDAPGNPDDIQLTTDVIRNRVAQLTYSREDALLRTSLSVSYRDLVYSDSKDLNRQINLFSADLGFPVTQLISGSVFLNFENIDLPNDASGLRNDQRFNFGATTNVAFTAKLSGNARVLYRTKESTNSRLNYDEFSVFVGLSYGIGAARDRTSPSNR
jgi:hypothetical protein